MKKRTDNKHVTKFPAPIIGYDSVFWAHCKEKDTARIMLLRRNEKREEYALLMKCDKGHVFSMTPYEYFFLNRTCIHCINKGEIGASKKDESLFSIWDEPNLILDQISESSTQLYHFCCPFCGSKFTSRMIDIINQFPKCKECNDGQEQTIPSKKDTSIYIFRER